MAGYTRQAAADISNGNLADADDLDLEFDTIQAAFHASTGHNHDGTTAGNGPKINLTSAASVTGTLPSANVDSTLTSKALASCTVTGSLVPTTDDGAPLGSTSNKFSDLFLASGAVINLNSGDVTITHSANLLTFAGASSGYSFDNTLLLPSAGAINFNGGDVTITHSANALAFAGATSGYSFDDDILLPSGGVINWNSGDVTITHSANALTFAGASSGYSFDADLTVTSVDAGAGVGPTLTLFRNSATPAANDLIGSVDFTAEDSGGGTDILARVVGQITDPTATSEDGALFLQAMIAGSINNYLGIGSSFVNFYFPAVPSADDGTSLGTTTRQWSDFFIASGGVINWNSGDVTITHSANTLTFAGATSGYAFGNGDVVATTGNIGATLGGGLFGRAAFDTAGNSATTGISLNSNGVICTTVSAGNVMSLNRTTDDGSIMLVRQDGTAEGTVSVSGTTVTWGTFLGSHWSQLLDGTRPYIPRGTIVESINEMCHWEGERENDKLPRFKISDKKGSKAVYGVFLGWDNDPEHKENDCYVAAVGAAWIRINKDVKVEIGDLIESNGDGTGRVQDDDIYRSKTVGKVTSTFVAETYEDGSYLVPATLHAG